MKQDKILIKSGLDKQGNQRYSAIKVYKRMPKDWKEDKGATTAPIGYKWITNGKSLFKGQRKCGFIKEDAIKSPKKKN